MRVSCLGGALHGLLKFSVRKACYGTRRHAIAVPLNADCWRPVAELLTGNIYIKSSSTSKVSCCSTINQSIIYLHQTTWVHRNIKSNTQHTSTQTQTQTLRPWCKPVNITDQRHDRIAMNLPASFKHSSMIV